MAPSFIWRSIVISATQTADQINSRENTHGSFQSKHKTKIEPKVNM